MKIISDLIEINQNAGLWPEGRIVLLRALSPCKSWFIQIYCNRSQGALVTCELLNLKVSCSDMPGAFFVGRLKSFKSTVRNPLLPWVDCISPQFQGDFEIDGQSGCAGFVEKLSKLLRKRISFGVDYPKGLFDESEIVLPDCTLVHYLAPPFRPKASRLPASSQLKSQYESTALTSYLSAQLPLIASFEHRRQLLWRLNGVGVGMAYDDSGDIFADVQSLRRHGFYD